MHRNHHTWSFSTFRCFICMAQTIISKGTLEWTQKPTSPSPGPGMMQEHSPGCRHTWWHNAASFAQLQEQEPPLLSKGNHSITQMEAEAVSKPFIIFPIAEAPHSAWCPGQSESASALSHLPANQWALYHSWHVIAAQGCQAIPD